MMKRGSIHQDDISYAPDIGDPNKLSKYWLIWREK